MYHEAQEGFPQQVPGFRNSVGIHFEAGRIMSGIRDGNLPNFTKDDVLLSLTILKQAQGLLDKEGDRRFSYKIEIEKVRTRLKELEAT